MAKNEEKPDRPQTSPGAGDEKPDRPARAPRIDRPDLLVDLEKGRQSSREKRSRDET